MRKPLAHLAFRSEMSIGRRRSDDRTFKWSKEPANCYADDMLRIMTSRTFMKMAGKKQVVSPSNFDGIGTRLRHSMGIKDMGWRISSALGLNHDLIQALAVVHDLGHPLFGHSGEIVFDDYLDSFSHETHGVNVVQEIEDLNLTYEVILGMLYHSLPYFELEWLPWENRLLCLLDKFDYSLRDPHDFITRVLIKQTHCFNFTNKERHRVLHDLKLLVKPLGQNINYNEWADNLLEAVIKESIHEGCVSFFNCQLAKDLWLLRDYLYNEVYLCSNTPQEKVIIRTILDYLKQSPWAKYDIYSIAAAMEDREGKTAARMIWGKPSGPCPYGENIEELLGHLKESYFQDKIPLKGQLNHGQPDLSWAFAKI